MLQENNNTTTSIHNNPFTFDTFDYAMRREFLTFSFYILALCSVALLPTHQLIVGTLVNSILISAAFRFNFIKIIGLSVVPSVVLVLTGIVFGGLTQYVVIMLPFVWLGNVAISGLVKYIITQKKYSSVFAIIAGATLKTTILFSTVAGYYLLGLIPAQLLVAFGVFQFITAVAGATIGLQLKKVNF
jgi:hypothetical protein